MLNISKLNNINTKNNIKSVGNFNNEIRYRPTYTKEWFNSVYHYNDKNMKNIPSSDLTVAKIITNYFNMFYSHLEKSVLIDRKPIWKRRLRLNKPLVAKPEFKHTNDKVFITLYVYNRELSWLKEKMIKIKRLFLAEYYHRVIVKNISTIKKITLLKTFGKNLNNLRLKMKNILKRIVSLKKSILIKNVSIKHKVYLLRINLPKWIFNNPKKLLNSSLRMLYTSVLKNNNISFLTKLKLSIKNSYYTQTKLNQFIEKRIRSKLNSYYKLISLFKDELINFKDEYWAYLHYLSKERKYKKKMRKVKSLNSGDRLLKVSKNITDEVSKVIQGLILNIFEDSHKNLDLKKYNIFTPRFNVDKYLYYLELLKVLHNMRLYIRYNRFIAFNKFKFNIFINPLKEFLEIIYKKNVEFNIVTLKSYHLNSSLLTKVVTSKIRNRKNSMLKVLQSVLSKVRIPVTRRLEYFNEISRNKHLQNIVLRNYLNKRFLSKRPMFNTNTYMKLIKNRKSDITLKKLYLFLHDNDKLNMVLNSIYNPQNIIYINKFNNENIEIRNRKIKNIVLDNIKNKTIGGIRLEASGRLTKRITAARSLFKMRQTGTIRNINASYKRIPSVLLRGNLRSNTQYTYLNSKTRIGSFGIKGWVSSM